MRTRRPLIAAVATCAAVGALCLSASAASADRTFVSKVTPFSSPSSISFDASGDAWFADAGQQNNPPGGQGIYKYDGFPSHTLLAAPNTYVPWAYYSLQLQLSVDQSTGEIFVTQANGRTVDIFSDSDGTFLREWSAINGTAGGGAAQGGIHVAVDNSNGPSRGRVYLSLTAPENDVEVVDAAQRPVDFPATTSYIHDNVLTGTPTGPFGEVQNISVDAAGNLYVTDTNKLVVDEFDSSGTFVRAFPDPAAADGNPGTGGAAADPTNGNVLIDGNNIDEYDSSGNHLETINQDGSNNFGAQGTPAVDSTGHVYAPSGYDRVDIFSPNVVVPAVTYKPVSSPTTTSGTLNATVGPNGAGPLTGCHFEYGTDASYGTTLPCGPDPTGATSDTDVSADVSGLTTGTTYHYRVVVTNADGTKYGADQVYIPQKVIGLRTDPASDVAPNSVTLNANVTGDGSQAHYYFEWGPTTDYGNTTAPAPGDDAGSPSSSTPLSTPLTGLTPYSTYHYRVIATNGAGTSTGADQMFTTPPGAPTAQGAAVTSVHADRAIFHGSVDPNGADTGVHFEYVDDADFQQSAWADASTAPSPDIPIGMSKHFQSASEFVDGLTEGTLYHYRVVGANGAGTGDDAGTFRTFGFTPSFRDPCPNSHVRQQTGSALLLDCRAYELVSAENAGGYDVESNLVAAQDPFGGYPDAESPSQVLYGVHNGGIPGTGDPTNHGVDPYVATRTDSGWSTRYVGIPADDPNANGPFASTLLQADGGLDTLAFGGEDICSPCFSDGSTGEPIHLSDGTLVQGMAGSIPQPDAVPAGFVAKHLSADGSHFVFGSTSQFEPDGNTNGDVTIYDRDLRSGVTHVVSKTPQGDTMTGDGIGELDISRDGSRVLIGKLVSTDSQGNRYWHLYMDVGDSGQSIDLMPGSTSGALYDGMSSDGSKVYFTTKDALPSGVPLVISDTDQSADIYRADVTSSGASLTRISTGSGGTGNSDSCDPAANTRREHWNTVGTDANCDAVAVGGGGGVASGDGSIYFLSPEKLDGDSGVQDAPNLYVDRPGSQPHFVTTLESSANAPIPPPAHPFLRSFSASFGNPAGVAIDHASGDIYLFDIGTGAGTGYVYKFDSAGHVVQSFGASGKLTVGGLLGFYNLPVGIAVDNDPSSPNYGDLYVPGLNDNLVRVFDPTGAHLTDITTSGTPTAVGIDPANGNVYVAEGYNGSSVDVFGPGGNAITSFNTISAPTGIAVDSSGNAYVVNGGGYLTAPGLTEKYSASGTDLGIFDAAHSNAVAVDPTNDHVFVDEVSRVVEFDTAGNQIGSPTGAGQISGSIGVAADSDDLAISDHGTLSVDTYGPGVVPTDPSTDSPLVVDSVTSAGTRNTADFQVTPSGDFAAFSSTLHLTGYDSAVHSEVFRYDAPADALDCVSCNPTDEQAVGDSTLATSGSSLADDGRVFFDSSEGLVDRDLNGKVDVYEWEKPAGEDTGTVQLISTGNSPADSRLLSTDADGTDAYFFTHDTLVSGDDNGNRVKLYDARVSGGFAESPEPIPCQASDECHGPGSEAPTAPDIPTIAGTPAGNVHPATKHGRKHHKRHKRHHKSHRRHAHGKGGAGK